MAQDWKLIGILTGTPDNRPQPSGTFHTPRWSVIAVKPSRRGGGWQGGVAAGQKYVKMDIKTSFFDVMSEIQKDLVDVLARIDIF
jgi:hypothetical protein